MSFTELVNLFENSEDILILAIKRLQKLYKERELFWTKETLTVLKGDVHCKVLGAFLQKKLGLKDIEIEYESKFQNRSTALNLVSISPLLLHNRLCKREDYASLLTVSGMLTRLSHLLPMPFNED